MSKEEQAGSMSAFQYIFLSSTVGCLTFLDLKMFHLTSVLD